MGLAHRAPMDQYQRKYHVTDHAVDQLRARGDGPNNDYPSRTVADLKNLIDAAAADSFRLGTYEDVIDDGAYRRIIKLPTLAEAPLYAVTRRADRGSDVIMTLLTEEFALSNKTNGKWMKKNSRTGDIEPASLTKLGDVFGEQLKAVALSSIPPPALAPIQQPAPTEIPTAPPAPPPPIEEAATVPKDQEWISRADAAKLLGVCGNRVSTLASEGKWERKQIADKQVAFPRRLVEALRASRRQHNREPGKVIKHKPHPNAGPVTQEAVARFEALCEHLNEDRQTLADRLGLSHSAFYKWRGGGNISDETLAKLTELENSSGLLPKPVDAPNVGRPKSVPNTTFAARIERLRSASGLSVLDFCKALGFERNSVYYNWLKGSMPQRRYLAAIKAFETKVFPVAPSPAVKPKPVADIKTPPNGAPAVRIVRLTDSDGKVSYQECSREAVDLVYQTLLHDGIPATAITVYKRIGVQLALQETE